MHLLLVAMPLLLFSLDPRRRKMDTARGQIWTLREDGQIFSEEWGCLAASFQVELKDGKTFGRLETFNEIDKFLE